MLFEADNDHPGLKSAIAEVLAEAFWQRCQTKPGPHLTFANRLEDFLADVPYRCANDETSISVGLSVRTEQTPMF
jgi:hypothetical protein